MRPSSSTPISTTSAKLCLHERRLEWCSYGPTNTSHRSSGFRIRASRYRDRRVEGMATPITSWSLLMAPVVPLPHKRRISSVPLLLPRHVFMYFVASFTIFPMRCPTKLSLVCVFPI
ncbi:hypothetical protein AMTR_s00071p00075870 [Amborella trichopoda]|uniref:Uncharacterized protein n=1 Tax=Amborella trichopoda TaxID=13333 RepID=U5D2P9_AMBTC|nr:hypothetical protein AMTR_s00071p00075870 [Amborella trichopoda]